MASLWLVARIAMDLADWPAADDERPELAQASAAQPATSAATTRPAATPLATEPTAGSPTPPEPTADLVAHGARVARAANCAGCHTARGGADYAGGRAIATPFGTVYAGNLTPDPSGLGGWQTADFRRALWRGRSRDGRLLVPAFPFTHYTRITRSDADALWAFLQQLPPVAQANRPHALRFPYNTQAAQAVWRALFFRPGRLPPDAQRSAAWNRGEYLVNGPGHCGACHGQRNGLGASAGLADGHGGAGLPQQRWVAPSLADPAEAGLSAWPVDEAVALLKTGWSRLGIAQGPMADVVLDSTQHLPDDDLRAMVDYLQSLPAPPPRTPTAGARPADPSLATQLAQGAELYQRHCVDCHGALGQGVPGVYPALAGNRLLTQASPANLVQAVTRGGFAPGTAGNPRPYGMPPYDLPDAELAALLSHLRQRFGGQAAPLTAVDVLILR